MARRRLCILSRKKSLYSTSRLFEAEMRAAKIDWQLVAYGNAVHSYSDVDANMPGKAQYNAQVATRAYAAMDAFFAEAFAK